jgi:predicted ATP-grasp superfamily ATP-dependent carboligase
VSARILVTDGEQRSALAAVRSLGKAGHQVEVCSERGASLAGASRFARADHRVPSPLDDPAAYAEAVAGLCRSREMDLLLPMTDASLLALLPARERMGPTRIPAPPADVHAAISDKERLLEPARAAGLHVPRTLRVGAPGELPAAGELPAFPLVVKPSRSVAQDALGDGLARASVSYADDADALHRLLEGLPPSAFPVLLQERIEGQGAGVFLLSWEGRRLAHFAHRRIREKPPTGGVSVYREAVHPDPELLAASTRLLEAFGWSGVAMVEFKRCHRTGRHFLMEVNGRFWGSLQLAIDAGVDFPRLLVSAALGEAVAPVTSYRAGVRSRWLLGDLDHLLIRMRTRYAPDQLPPGAGGRWRAAVSVLLPWRPGDRWEVVRASDPHPGLREFSLWLSEMRR